MQAEKASMEWLRYGKGHNDSRWGSFVRIVKLNSKYCLVLGTEHDFKYGNTFSGYNTHF